MAGEQRDPDQAQGPARSGGVRPGGRYSAFVGIAFIGLIVVAAINAASTGEGTILGTERIRGEPLPEFAVPDIRGGLDGDANVAQDDCETSSNPCPASQRRTPACEIDTRGAIQVCDLFERPLALSFWFTRGADCVPAQDVLDELARDYRGRVNFLSVNVRDDRDEVEGLVAERGWRMPMGWDRDGAVSNIYRIGVCPTVAFVYPGGIFHSAAVGERLLDPRYLRERLDTLIRASRKRGAGG